MNCLKISIFQMIAIEVRINKKSNNIIEKKNNYYIYIYIYIFFFKFLLHDDCFIQIIFNYNQNLIFVFNL